MYRILNADGEAIPGTYETAEEAEAEALRLRVKRRVAFYAAEEYEEGYTYLDGDVQLSLF